MMTMVIAMGWQLFGQNTVEFVSSERMVVLGGLSESVMSVKKQDMAAAGREVTWSVVGVDFPHSGVKTVLGCWGSPTRTNSEGSPAVWSEEPKWACIAASQVSCMLV